MGIKTAPRARRLWSIRRFLQMLVHQGTVHLLKLFGDFEMLFFYEPELFKYHGLALSPWYVISVSRVFLKTKKKNEILNPSNDCTGNTRKFVNVNFSDRRVNQQREIDHRKTHDRFLCRTQTASKLVSVFFLNRLLNFFKSSFVGRAIDETDGEPDETSVRRRATKS